MSSVESVMRTVPLMACWWIRCAKSAGTGPRRETHSTTSCSSHSSTDIDSVPQNAGPSDSCGARLGMTGWLPHRLKSMLRESREEALSKLPAHSSIAWPTSGEGGPVWAEMVESLPDLAVHDGLEGTGSGESCCCCCSETGKTGTDCVWTRTASNCLLLVLPPSVGFRPACGAGDGIAKRVVTSGDDDTCLACSGRFALTGPSAAGSVDA
mmetsp:Transcript_19312/g.58016  ORF Transcript_19312/g.58016 Transcript_19312/m.58016 type:complete len:210 (-) Transcript_19312:509-1138(-)